MRRLLLALVSTAAGLAAVLSFKTQGSAATSGAAAAPQTGTQASSSAPASTGSAGSGSAGTASGSGSTSAGSKSSTAGTAGTGGGRTLTGAVSNTPYGPMQVQVTMAARKITGVKVLQETNDGVMSQQIDANAVPQLTKETLAAQSARIDAVSGASYTSAGYIKSLQSALDQANA
jgi:uncharacterized protein with FMN-binding domain